MTLRLIAAAVVAIILVLLGALWFLQGIDAIRVCPILCFADCECRDGGSMTYAVLGAVCVFVGGTIAAYAARRYALTRR